MKNKNKFGFGGYVDPISEYLNIKRQRASNIPNQIESPDQAIADNNIRLSRAQQKAMSNPLTQGLDIFGNIAMQVGSSMMSKGISAGEGENGKGIAGFLNKNQNFINTLLGGLNAGASFATGGVAGNKKINAEGGEVVETPDGLSQELVGPSHAEGGIDMTVPSGTEIYSDKLLGADGKTMAERKKAREKQISKIEKLLQKNPNDSALKKTLEKIKQNNDFLDKQDLFQMQFVKDLVGSVEAPREEYKLGSVVGGNPIPGYNKKNIFYPNIFMDPELMDKISNIGALDTNVGTKFKIDPNIEEKLIGANAKINFNNSEDGVVPIDFGENAPDNNYYFNKATGSKGKFGMYQEVDSNDNPIGDPVKSISGTGDAKNFSLDDYLGGTTFGDMLGMGANLFGPMAQMNNTLENRSATPVEQNWFKDYGKQALSKIQDQYGLLDDIRDNALSSLEKDRAGSISRNNASTRSINTQRALNLATDAAINNNKSDLYSKFAQSMLGVKSQEAAQMDRNDQMRMSGEDKRAERELQNTDNFFNNMAKNISDKYRGIGETGKAINDIKERTVTGELMEQIYKNFSVNPKTGKLEVKKDASEVSGITPSELNLSTGKGNTEKLYDKDGNPTKELLDKIKADPNASNYKNAKGEKATPEEIAKNIWERNKNPYIKPLEEFDTSYKNKIDPDTGLRFSNYNNYNLAIQAKREIKDAMSIIGKYKGSELSQSQKDIVEKILNEKGINLDLDNVASIKAFQKAMGLKPDGKIGPKTLKAMGLEK